MTLTADQALGLATQAVKERFARDLYLRPSTTHRRHRGELIHRITDHEKPRGKQLICYADSHEQMMDKLAEIKAQRIVRDVATVLIKALIDNIKEKSHPGARCEALGFQDPETGVSECSIDVRGGDCLCNAIMEARQHIVDGLSSFNLALQGETR